MYINHTIHPQKISQKIGLRTFRHISSLESMFNLLTAHRGKQLKHKITRTRKSSLKKLEGENPPEFRACIRKFTVSINFRFFFFSGAAKQ